MAGAAGALGQASAAAPARARQAGSVRLPGRRPQTPAHQGWTSWRCGGAPAGCRCWTGGACGRGRAAWPQTPGSARAQRSPPLQRNGEGANLSGQLEGGVHTLDATGTYRALQPPSARGPTPPCSPAKAARIGMVPRQRLAPDSWWKRWRMCGHALQPASTRSVSMCWRHRNSAWWSRWGLWYSLRNWMKWKRM